MSPLKSQAIQTALTGDWNAAVNLNRLLLEENPDDIDTLNRLAFAFSSLGNIKEAKNIYQKVLQLDTQNPIALRNLKRLTGSPIKKSTGNGFSISMNNIFIEEPGKTKIVELINIAESKLLSQLRSGEILLLSVKRSKIFVLDSQKQYIGMLPDDLSRRLIKFINGGNKYEAFVKTVNNHKMTVFIKEIKRAVRFKNQPSFASGEKTKLTFDNTPHLKNREEKDAKIDEEKDDLLGQDDNGESF